MRLDFDPREYVNRGKSNGKSAGIGPVPEGHLHLECIALNAVVSKAGDRMLKATFEVIDPPIATPATSGTTFLMERAANIDALEIARERLAKWAEAAGKPDLKDTDELEHTQVPRELAIDPGRGDYGPSKQDQVLRDGRPKTKANR